MSRVAKKIFLSDAELTTLSKWVRSGKTENRLVFRARIILEAHRGLDNKRIAKYLNTTASTIGKWRYRFMNERIEG
ncbi:MAG: helix-turn-helix domain-containing protein, partial [Calditrichaeota bacterium]|nr:helix-turn-helix domain-containing protein [Calditrichota bacterium]